MSSPIISDETDIVEVSWVHELVHDGTDIKPSQKPAQRSRLPLLSKMGIDIHSIPPISAKPERLFSGSKHTISDQRNSLKSKTIETLECLKSCFRLGVFTEQDLHAIVGRLNEEGAIEALEAIINQ